MEAEIMSDDVSAGSSFFRTEELTKHFGGINALSDVSVSINPGELRCIIGPNGAGKSTFLKLVTGQLTPTKGRIVYKGEDITDLSPHKRIRRGISLKFQVPSVYEELSVRDNMRIPLQRYHSDLDDTIKRTLEEFNLLSQADLRAESLSHGQRQWLEIGMAVAIEPELLLLDEPTAGMTIEETRQTAAMIRALNDEQDITLIVIEHDIDFVRDIAESVTVFHQGTVFAEGSMDEIEANTEVRRIYLGETET